jgi:CheY-like chemotaxis protein
MYAEYLEHKGFRVLTARSGMEGFTRARESVPYVVTADLTMPNIDDIHQAAEG